MKYGRRARVEAPADPIHKDLFNFPMHNGGLAGYSYRPVNHRWLGGSVVKASPPLRGDMRMNRSIAVASPPSDLQHLRPAMHWWENGWLWAALAIISSIPLWLPSISPLVDLPGHLGRYRIQLDLDTSETLRKYFSFRWALIGNLGFDLLIMPLAPLVGLEMAVKLIVMAIPALGVAGIYWVAREVHGRVPPTALFAVPFLYNFPFNFGFTNFALSMSLALIALGGWLRLSTTGNWRIRAAAFAPISCLLWLAHAFGWAFLLLTAWSAELVRRHDEGQSFMKAGVKAGIACIPLCIPFLLMIFWRSGAPADGTGGFFGFASKFFSMAAVLRDRWLLWDAFSAAVAVVLIGSAIFDERMSFSRRLALPATVLTITFFVMPTTIFGSAYADMRLAPFMVILAVCAVRFRDPEDTLGAHLLANLGIAFLALRLAGTTLSFAVAEREMRTHTEALDHIPNGSRVLSLVGNTCASDWEMPRHSHLGSLVIERKRGFSNDQWRLPGTQLLQIHYPLAGSFAFDPSEHVFSQKCIDRTLARMKRARQIDRLRGKVDKEPLHLGRSVEGAILEFPRWAFDYVWVLKAPDFDMGARPGLTPIWRSSESVLYRVDPWWTAFDPHNRAAQRLPEPIGAAPAK